MPEINIVMNEELAEAIAFYQMCKVDTLHDVHFARLLQLAVESGYEPGKEPDAFKLFPVIRRIYDTELQHRAEGKSCTLAG